MVGVHARAMPGDPNVVRARWRDWARWAAVGAFLFLVVTWLWRPRTAGDTPFVLDGTNALVDCLSHHVFVACRKSEHLDYWGLLSPMGDWPAYQHLIDLVPVTLGIDDHPDRTRLLATLSVAGVVACVGLGWIVLTRVGQRAWFWGFLAVVLSGPIIAYARSTGGEALASGLLVCVVAVAVLRARPPLVALAVFAACLTKETSYPFVLALAWLGLVLARRRVGEPVRSHVVWSAAGALAAFVLASLFNVVRFGSILNTNYLQPELHTPGIGRKLEYLCALFVSPSGGMIVFWPAASALVAAACVLPFLRRGPADRMPALVLVGVIVFLAVGFASWWTPFGWSEYGPRLSLPWVLPLVLLALVAYGEPLGELSRRLLSSTWRVLAVSGVLLALALPHVGYMWQVSSIQDFFVGPNCDAPWRSGIEKSHACMHGLIWTRRPVGTFTVRGVATAGGAVTSVVLAAGLLGCLLAFRTELQVRAFPAPYRGDNEPDTPRVT